MASNPSTNVRFSIVVPTRERARTLAATLRSVLNQDYANFEVIVCDNDSRDNTLDVVKQFNDKRVRYFNTKVRLPMHENWNFAISKIQGDYVTVIGDDDALLPSALRDIESLIIATNSKAINWDKADYCWPDHPRSELRNLLAVPLANKLFQIDAVSARRDLGRFIFPYSRTPTLYNSAVQSDVVAKCILHDGTFFKSASPDIYSGVALLSRLDSYIFSSRPFSVNGASAASTGTGSVLNANSTAFNMFSKELGKNYAYLFGKIDGSVNSEVLEALLRANVHHYSGQLKISMRAAIFRICRDLAIIGGPRRDKGLHELSIAAQEHGYSWTLRLLLFLFGQDRQRKIASINLSTRGRKCVDGARYGIGDVYDASVFAATLLGPYERPRQIAHYSAAKRIFGVVGSRIMPTKFTDTFVFV